MLENRKFCLNHRCSLLAGDPRASVSIHWPQRVNNSCYMVACLTNKSMGLCEATDTPGVPEGTTSLCLWGITKVFCVCGDDLTTSMSNHSYQLPVSQLIAGGNMQAVYIYIYIYIQKLLSWLHTHAHFLFLIPFRSSPLLKFRKEYFYF